MQCHSNMVRGLVPSMSDMSADYHFGNGGTWSVTRNTQLGTESAILMSRSNIRAEPFCSWIKDLVPSMSDVSVGHSNEQFGCKGNCHSPGEWRRLVS